MRKDLFEYFITDNLSGKKCTEKWLSKNNNELFVKIINWCDSIEVLNNLEFKRKVYHYINNLKEIPICSTCKGTLKYKRIVDGYGKYCSNKCAKLSREYKEKWLSSWKNNNSDGKSIEKRIKTCKERYGSDFEIIFQKKKIEKNIELYGVKYQFELSSFKEKRKKSLKEKYGNENFNNPDKTKNTRIKNGTQIDDKLINDFNSYKKVAINRTINIYINNKQVINTNNLKRGRKEYHIDHLFSIKQGFLLNIPIEIITHPCNLHMIYYMDNLIKQDNCWITIEELLTKIIEYDKYIKSNSSIKEEFDNIKIKANQILNKINKNDN